MSSGSGGGGNGGQSCSQLRMTGLTGLPSPLYSTFSTQEPHGPFNIMVLHALCSEHRRTSSRSPAGLLAGCQHIRHTPPRVFMAGLFSAWKALCCCHISGKMSPWRGLSDRPFKTSDMCSPPLTSLSFSLSHSLSFPKTLISLLSTVRLLGISGLAQLS